MKPSLQNFITKYLILHLHVVQYNALLNIGGCDYYTRTENYISITELQYSGLMSNIRHIICVILHVAAEIVTFLGSDKQPERINQRFKDPEFPTLDRQCAKQYTLRNLLDL